MGIQTVLPDAALLALALHHPSSSSAIRKLISSGQLTPLLPLSATWPASATCLSLATKPTSATILPSATSEHDLALDGLTDSCGSGAVASSRGAAALVYSATRSLPTLVGGLLASSIVAVGRVRGGRRGARVLSLPAALLGAAGFLAWEKFESRKVLEWETEVDQEARSRTKGGERRESSSSRPRARYVSQGIATRIAKDPPTIKSSSSHAQEQRPNDYMMYVSKGIATRITMEPPTIKLLFSHKNDDQLTGEDAYYAQSKENNFFTTFWNTFSTTGATTRANHRETHPGTTRATTGDNPGYHPGPHPGDTQETPRSTARATYPGPGPGRATRTPLRDTPGRPPGPQRPPTRATTRETTRATPGRPPVPTPGDTRGHPPGHHRCHHRGHHRGTTRATHRAPPVGPHPGTPGQHPVPPPRPVPGRHPGHHPGDLTRPTPGPPPGDHPGPPPGHPGYHRGHHPGDHRGPPPRPPPGPNPGENPGHTRETPGPHPGHHPGTTREPPGHNTAGHHPAGHNPGHPPGHPPGAPTPATTLRPAWPSPGHHPFHHPLPPPLSTTLYTTLSTTGATTPSTTRAPPPCEISPCNTLETNAVVPACYRKNFPIQLKSHRSHDVVLLCFDCHQVAQKAAERVKRQIADELSIPLVPPHMVGWAASDASGGPLADESQGAAPVVPQGIRMRPEEGRRAAIALSRSGDLMPPDRVRKLEDVIKIVLGRNPAAEPRGLQPAESEPGGEPLGDGTADAVPPRDLPAALAVVESSSLGGGGHSWHGAQVVSTLLESEGEEALHALCYRFRSGFVAACNPSHLPPSWRVDQAAKRNFGEYSIYKGNEVELPAPPAPPAQLELEAPPFDNAVIATL
eukprot:gene11060-18667_t